VYWNHIPKFWMLWSINKWKKFEITNLISNQHDYIQEMTHSSGEFEKKWKFIKLIKMEKKSKHLKENNIFIYFETFILHHFTWQCKASKRNFILMLRHNVKEIMQISLFGWYLQLNFKGIRIEKNYLKAKHLFQRAYVKKSDDNTFVLLICVKTMKNQKNLVFNVVFKGKMQLIQSCYFE
jgi:hypothetical protein